MQITELFNVINLTREFRKVKRKVRYDLTDQGWENDMEHSYQLAIVAWYIADKGNINLNKELIFQYALAHDLVEVYSGDVDSINASKETMSSKSQKEQLALLEIKKKYPDFESLWKIIEDYENRATPECLFVYSIDKFLPVINTYISKDPFYMNSNVSFDKWVSWLDSKVNRDKSGEYLYDEVILKLLEFLKENGEGFFAKE
jgi:5'-deoxynucleotidase YfbR-like HD superfamily hydrolase